MAKMPRTTPQPKKLVWRISATAPQGEWVDPSQPAAAPPKLAEPEVSTGSWVTSSFDLLSGTDVEESPDSLSPDQFEQMFRAPGAKPKRP
ncbi:MAG: hypothetical protein KA151_10920 [Piscinibacter sp.]|jgi:hypothetical protein|nr:hypothetical protein [Piscinibacter sp.]